MLTCLDEEEDGAPVRRSARCSRGTLELLGRGQFESVWPSLPQFVHAPNFSRVNVSV